MIDSFIHQGNVIVIALLLIISLGVVTAIGYHTGSRHRKQAEIDEKREKTAATITGAMLALLGFMMAISLSMSDSQFESRRRLILEEANSISTSSLRARAVGGEHGTQIAALLKDYTKLRIDFFAAGEDRDRLQTIYQQTSVLQGRIWDHASAIARGAPSPISALLLSSLNETFDLAASRRWILEVRVPPYVIKLLLLFSLLSMVVMGYYFGLCGVTHPLLMGCLFIALTFMVLLIIDLDRPRSGYVMPEQSPLNWLSEAADPGAPGRKTGETGK